MNQGWDIAAAILECRKLSSSSLYTCILKLLGNRKINSAVVEDLLHGNL